MSDQTWDAPILELSRPMTAYLLWLVARDLGEWDAERRTKLAREEAVALSAFLSDFLPPEMLTPIETPPLLRAG